MAKSATQKRRREAEASQDNQGAETDQETNPSKKARLQDGRSLFVRDLPSSATSQTLTECFSQHYPVKHATVVTDPKTKASRGYGFVTFADADDAKEAKETLSKITLDGRHLRLDLAEPRHRKGGLGGVPSRVAEEKKKREESRAEALKLPKLIVRNLPWSIKTSVDLAALFRMYGKVKYSDLPQLKGKLSGFGFVTLRGRKNAERAIEGVNGKVVDGRTLAIDWAVDKQTWEQQQKAEGPESDDPAIRPAQTETAEEDGSEQDSDEDEEMDEADADVQNFFKNRLEHLEDEESDKDEDDESDKGEAGADDDWEDDEADEVTGSTGNVSEEKKKTLTTDNSTTLFVRNLPFTTTDQELKAHFGAFGAVRYARIVMDRSTDRPAGTGFVCYFNVEDMMSCLKDAPRQKPVSTLGKRSVLQDETVDRDGRYTMDGRVLQIAQAVAKEEANRLSSEGEASRSRQEKDKRRLYLLSEGTISNNTPLYAVLPPAEIQMREASAKQRKKMVDSNPSLHMSLTRLAVRNIPQNIDSKALKALAREAVVGFAKDVKDGRRQPISKEENARGGQLDKEAERRRKVKGKGVVTQAKVVFETKEGSKVAEETGAGKSRGYGFIEYSSHRWALMGLRWLNGHELKNTAGKATRLIVEFAIENVNVVSRRRANEDRARNHEPQPRDRAPAGRGRAGDAGKFGKKGGPDSRKASKSKKPDSKDEPKQEAKQDTTESKKSKTDAKLALRQQIIGRKRMMRKKKGPTRQGK